MSVDLSQFHQVFYEESFEGLDVMESALMALDPDDVDSETINQIFRAAHSIKGGSATFGMSVVAEFTHILETLLDEIRDGKRQITTDHIDLFLESVDCLRDLLTALQGNETPDSERSDELKKAFEAILAEGGTATSSVVGDTAEEVSAATTTSQKAWNIFFKPGSNILQTGNEPARMFRELASFGQVTATANIEALPDFDALNPDHCYLSWMLEVVGDVTEDQINEVFEWVVDECEIHIEEVEVADSTATAAQAKGWHITFKPEKDLLVTGNDPLKMLRELAGLGDIKVTSYIDNLPDFDAMNPEHSYLAWDIELIGDIEESSINHIFEWVVDQCDLSVKAFEKNIAANSSAEQSATETTTDNVTALENSKTSKQEVPPEKQKADSGKAKPAARNSGSADSGSIRVAIDKVDTLINMVGELVITQSMLGQVGTNFTEDQLPRLLEGLSQLEHNTRELQESVMRIRMLPISFAFNRFPRMVRDLSRRLGKSIELVLTGEQTELDKTVMERIGDPLVHLVRNSVDHGIEMPDDRAAAGKSKTGKITLNAFHQSGNVVIEIIDDGKGLDRDRILEKALNQGLISEQDKNNFTDGQVFDLIFHPGFSTAAQVSDVSGRGVGMDVVKRNIQELNGSVDIASETGVGTTITIRLPLTLAILDGQLVRVGSNTYIFPLVSIVESMQVDDSQVNIVAGGCEVFQLRNEYIPVVKLFELFNVEPDSRLLKESLLVVVESDGEKIGVVVDELEAQQQVVIKSLEQNYQRVEGVSGATILGDGTVSLILDIPGMVNIAGENHRQGHVTRKYSQSTQLQQRLH